MGVLFDCAVLNRRPEYYEGLEKRLGFDVTDGRALLVHCAGVTFENRQKLLKALHIFCSFDKTPPIKLELEPDNVYDRYAIKVLAATSFTELDGEPVFSHIGYVPKARCPLCATTFSGKKATTMVCSTCGDISSYPTRVLNKFVTDNFDKVRVGLDAVTKSVGGKSYGLDIWIRAEE